MRGPHVEKRRWLYRGQTRTSDFYYLVFYVKTPRGAKRVYRRTNPPTDQKRIALEQLHKMLAAGPQPVGAATRVAAVFEAYRAYLKEHKPTTHRARRVYLERLIEMFGGRSVASFGPAQIDALVTDMTRRKYAESTKAANVALVHSAFAFAVSRDLIEPHPILRVKNPFRYPERHETWTATEVKAVCDEMPGWAARYTVLMLLTGLRKSDALRLRWEQIGPDRIGPLSQGKTKRPVTVPLTKALAKLLDSFPGERKGFLFTSPRGGCYSPKSYANHFYAALRATQIENRTVHDLRRTFATRAYNQGVPPALIAELLGQRDTRLVQRYTHAEFDTLAAMAELAAGPPQLAATPVAVAQRRPAKR